MKLDNIIKVLSVVAALIMTGFLCFSSVKDAISSSDIDKEDISSIIQEIKYELDEEINFEE